MKELLLQSRSKKHIQKVAAMAAQNRNLFKELIQLMKDTKDLHLAALAAWAMNGAFEKNKLLIVPYYKELIQLAKKSTSDGIKRNIVRVWSFAEIPEKFRWDIADICFKYLITPKESIAVKAFSISVLQQLIKYLPELKEEVVFELEKQLPHASAGFVVRANAFLNNV